MNIRRASDFLQKQAESCLERSQNTTDADVILKYSILADIYHVFSATLSILSYPKED